MTLQQRPKVRVSICTFSIYSLNEIAKFIRIKIEYLTNERLTDLTKKICKISSEFNEIHKKPFKQRLVWLFLFFLHDRLYDVAVCAMRVHRTTASIAAPYKGIDCVVFVVVFVALPCEQRIVHCQIGVSSFVGDFADLRINLTWHGKCASTKFQSLLFILLMAKPQCDIISVFLQTDNLTITGQWC